MITVVHEQRENGICGIESVALNAFGFKDPYKILVDKEERADVIVKDSAVNTGCRSLLQCFVQRLERLLRLYCVIFKIDEFLCLPDLFDLIFIAIVRYWEIPDVSSLIDREIKSSEIPCIGSSGRILCLEFVENIVIVVHVAEHHEINLLEPSLDLMLGTAEVIEHIEQKARDRKSQDDNDPDELKSTIMVS